MNVLPYVDITLLFFLSEPDVFAPVYKIISSSLQASILGNIEKLKLLGPRRCFVEFGAGKGKLSHWVDIALKDAEEVHFILVEKVTTRFKVNEAATVSVIKLFALSDPKRNMSQGK